MKGKIIKALISLCLVATMVMSSFAAVVSDDDASAFVTKSEFEALKSNYDNQIKSYLGTVDEKIDNTIANYLNNFAGGAGGKLKMSEKTAVYMHKLKLKTFSGVDVSNAGIIFEFYSTYKNKLTTTDVLAESQYVELMGPLFGKYGIGWDKNYIQHDNFYKGDNLLFKDDMEQIVSRGTKRIIYRKNIGVNVTVGEKTYTQASGSINWGWGRPLGMQYSLTSGDTTEYLTPSNAEFDDEVSILTENPVDFGTQYAISGEMLSKAQLRFGLDQATYKHEIQLTKMRNTALTGDIPTFSFYTTSPTPLTAADLVNMRYADGNVPWAPDVLPVFRTYGFATGVGGWSRLKYTQQDMEAAQKVAGNSVEVWSGLAHIDGTNQITKIFYTYQTADMYVHKFQIRLEAKNATTGQNITNIYNTVQEITDTVTVASTNPLDYGSKHLVTGDMIVIGQGDVEVSGAAPEKFSLGMEGCNFSQAELQNSTYMLINDHGEINVPVQIGFVMKLTSTTTACHGYLGALYYNGVRLGLSKSFWTASYSTDGKIDLAWNAGNSSDNQIYINLRETANANASYYFTINSTMSRKTLVSAGLLAG